MSNNTVFYPLSHPQKRVWYSENITGNSQLYNVGGYFKIKGKTDFKLLEEAINVLIKTQDSFRLNIVKKEEKIFQYVEPYSKVNIDYIDFSLYKDVEVKFNNWSKSNFEASLLNEESYLYYFAICKISEEEHRVFIKMHHIISDGWSFEIIVKQICDIYTKLKNIEEVCERSENSYIDYINREIEYLNSDRFIKDKDFWLKKLADSTPVKIFEESKDCKADRVSFDFSEDMSLKIREFIKEHKLSLNSFFTSVFFICINKMHQIDELVIGIPVFNRKNKKERNSVGMYTSTMPFAYTLNNYQSSINIMKDINTELKSCLHHQRYPFDILEQDLRLREKGNNSLIQIIVNCYNASFDNIVNDMPTEVYDVFNNNQLYPLHLIIKDWSFNGNIALMAEYKVTDIIEFYIQNMLKHINTIITHILIDPNTELAHIELLTEEDKNQILVKFNNTDTEYPRDKTIQQLFEEQTEKTPDQIAVVYNSQKLTYKEINRKSNQLAKILRDKGASNNIVAIMVERSLEMIIGILAILKAGAAYLPIDSEYPSDRVLHMLDDSRTTILLTQSWINKGVVGNREIINLDDEELYKGTEENLSRANNTSTAYIMYTSGSTGKPKGVIIEHKSVIRLVKNTNYISFEENDRILQTGAVVFDACTFEFWGALLNGSELYITDKNKILDVDELEKALITNKITILWLTSSLFNRLAQQKPEIFSYLRYLLVGGDVLTPKYINLVRSKCKKLKIVNGYGPTENTTFSTCHLIDREYEVNIPIGKPISNSKAYIIDKFNKLCPIGIAGELCVGGDGLASGYLNSPELTAEKFVANPFGQGERIYKTGDMARWLPDGNIEFIGRMDNQIKLRGYRIELGEIENKLRNHQKIKEAIVILKEDSNSSKYLCAYYVSNVELIISELRDYLSIELPEYMVPSHFIQISDLPLTPNGKIDRKRLPEPDKSIATGVVYEAPRNSVEEKLAIIWGKTLDIEIVGIKDNFFVLGGDSIKAMQVSNMIQRELNVVVSLSEIFKNPTIFGISKIINQSKTCLHNGLVRLPDCNYYELSYSQKRLWIINQLEPDSIAYNMAGRINIKGYDNEGVIKKVFKALFQRHEGFRTHFEVIDGETMQIIANELEPGIEVIDLSGKASEEKETLVEEIYNVEAKKIFDLSISPLINIKLVRLKADELEIIIVMHHIISDGFSIVILKKEFEHIYNAYINGLNNELEPLKIQYKDFAAWQNEYIKNHSKDARGYWNKKLMYGLKTLNLPTNAVLVEKYSKESAAYRIVINKVIKDRLVEISKSNNTSLFIVLLTGFTAFLSNLTGQANINIGIPSLGREADELKNIIGYFVNTLILSNNVDMESKFTELLKEINEDTLKALEYQYYPLELSVEELKINYPQIRVFFNMLNFNKSAGSHLLNHEPCHLEKVQDVKFDIACYLTEYEDGIEIICNYYTALFEASRIELFMKNYIKLLEEVCKNTDDIIKNYFRSERKRIIKRN